jgi:hypothetical protein
MNAQERMKNQALVNSMIINGMSANDIAEAKKVLLPPVPEKKAKKGKADKKPSVASQFGRGNNGQFLYFMHKNCGDNYLETIEPSKADSDKAELIVNSMINWLKERSPAGSDTQKQNAVFSEYLIDILSGSNMTEAKVKTRVALEPLGSAYQIFTPALQLRNWYHTQTPSFVSLLNALNLI